MGSIVSIDSDELEALRVLARKHLSSSEQDGCAGPGSQVADENGSDSDDPIHAPRPLGPVTWQEANAIETLVMARGAVVPSDRIIRHIRTNGIHAEADEWVQHPRSQVSRIKDKMWDRFGCECIEAVWPTRVNRKGHVVRDQSQGLLGYRWIGPDIVGGII